MSHFIKENGLYKSASLYTKKHINPMLLLVLSLTQQSKCEHMGRIVKG